MPIADSALQRLRDAFVSTDSSQADGAPALRLSDTGAQTFSSIIINANGAATLTTDAADTIAQRDGTDTQEFRVYNTFTTLNTAGEWASLGFKVTANVFTIRTAAGSSSGTVRAMVIQPAAQPTATTVGAAVSLIGGAGSATGLANGGAVAITGGAAGAAGGGTGGTVTITSGASLGNNAGAALALAIGTSGTTANAAPPNAGAITITGTAGVSSTNASGTGSIGSTLTLTGGAGGTASGATSATGGLGGGITLTAGNGGTITGTTTAIGGAGGAISITAGNGATATTGSGNTAGVGGSVVIVSGDSGASGGNVNGGGIRLTTGAKVGSGLKRIIELDAAGSVPTTAVLTASHIGFLVDGSDHLIAYWNKAGAIKSLDIGALA